MHPERISACVLKHDCGHLCMQRNPPRGFCAAAALRRSPRAGLGASEAFLSTPLAGVRVPRHVARTSKASGVTMVRLCASERPAGKRTGLFCLTSRLTLHATSKDEQDPLQRPQRAARCAMAQHSHKQPTSTLKQANPWSQSTFHRATAVRRFMMQGCTGVAISLTIVCHIPSWHCALCQGCHYQGTRARNHRLSREPYR